MIKVITKALSVLRYISIEPEKPSSLKEVSEALKINLPTCARLLKALAEEYYIEQVAPRGGYVLGPMAYYLASRGVYRKEIALPGAPVVSTCAQEIGEFVTLATYYKGTRYVLAHENGNPELQIKADMHYYQDVYTTATGRLLFAYQTEEEIDSYIHLNGLPSGKWNGADTAPELKSMLAQIRHENFCIDADGDQTVKFAYPVFENDVVVAAFGVAMLKTRFSGSHKDFVLKTAARYAARISELISKGEIV